MYLQLCIFMYRYMKWMQVTCMLSQVKNHKFSCVASITENILSTQTFVLNHPINPTKFLEV